MPIDKVIRKKHKTTIEGRTSVIRKSAEGKSYPEIAEITGILKSQAAEIVKE
jgi:hypothetical protein